MNTIEKIFRNYFRVVADRKITANGVQNVTKKSKINILLKITKFTTILLRHNQNSISISLGVS